MLVVVVGGVPIAMPTVLSVTLALGAAKLAKEGAIVARMSAVEEMAGMDILCSDKTGLQPLRSMKCSVFACPSQTQTLMISLLCAQEPTIWRNSLTCRVDWGWGACCKMRGPPVRLNEANMLYPCFDMLLITVADSSGCVQVH